MVGREQIQFARRGQFDTALTMLCGLESAIRCVNANVGYLGQQRGRQKLGADKGHWVTIADPSLPLLPANAFRVLELTAIVGRTLRCDPPKERVVGSELRI